MDQYEHADPNLIYVEENIPTPATQDHLNEQYIAGCACEDNCYDCECVQKSGARYQFCEKDATESYKIDIVDAHRPVYECNASCRCSGRKCGHSLVQWGPRSDLLIIDCDRNLGTHKGLGLTSAKPIAKDNFVCEYAGEVITSAEASERYKANEKANRSNYIFCIREEIGEAPCNQTLRTFIDPSQLGNIGRYINHSCDPNCQLIPIRVNNNVPKLCIFALRDIPANTEITFDYGNGSAGYAPEDTNAEMLLRKCLCRSTVCRQYLPYCKELAQ